MGFKSYSHLQGYQVAEIKKMFDDGAIEPAVRLTAIHLARMTRNNLRGSRNKPEVVRPGQWTGKMMNDIRAKKGKYPHETTWIYGVLGKYDPGNWENSTGAEAIFYEYGRSAKGKGRNRLLGRRKPQKIKDRPQPPRPFIRQTVAEGKRKLFGVTGKEVSKICKKIKTGRIPKKTVRNIFAS